MNFGFDELDLPWRSIKYLLLGGVSVLLLSMGLAAAFYGRIWLQAYWSNARVSFLNLVAMSLRQVDIQMIVKARIMLAQAGIVSRDLRAQMAKLEAHYLAGGNVEQVVSAVVVASRSGMELDFDNAAAIDLAGRNVLEAVQTSVLPRVINCPRQSSHERLSLSAVARDGVELRIQALVTVRTNLSFLVGGATEATIIARVGQGIISVVGTAEAYTDVLRKPEGISQLLIEQGLDSNTSYRIVSIDIARIDVGENIGARIRTDQAEADMRVSRSLSESRRAEAIALHQEMRAMVRQRESDLIQAESLVQKALGMSVRRGRIGKLRLRKRIKRTSL